MRGGKRAAISEAVRAHGKIAFSADGAQVVQFSVGGEDDFADGSAHFARVAYADARFGADEEDFLRVHAA